MSHEFKKWILKNSNGVKITVLNIGGAIQKWEVPVNGKMRDIVLGFENSEEYLENKPSFGVLIGRYANRINKGVFTLNGKDFQLPANNGGNHLHGGPNGFGRQIWSGLQFSDQKLRLTYFSPDGEEGYPGNLDVRVDYELSNDNSLIITYWARTDQDTVLNLTNHSYFNLDGHNNQGIEDHTIRINSSRITENDSDMIPTGSYREIEGLENECKVSDLIENHFKEGSGIDDNFVLDEGTYACKLASSEADLVMKVSTTEPGMQIFTANFKELKYPGKGNIEYGHHSGIALESQHFPDSPNQPDFPNTLLKEGKEFSSKTEYKLSFS